MLRRHRSVLLAGLPLTLASLLHVALPKCSFDAGAQLASAGVQEKKTNERAAASRPSDSASSDDARCVAHGRLRSQCRQCGGFSFGQHGRRRATCATCGGSQVCPHGRQRMHCLACCACERREHRHESAAANGPARATPICVHNRVRYQCRPCGGKGICEHSKRRSQCRDCMGSAVCIHRKQKYTCRQCLAMSRVSQDVATRAPSRYALCPHGQRVFFCKSCGGANLCPHGIARVKCRECGGAALCCHDRHRYSCADCMGAGICLHGKLRQYCKECGGVSICAHGKQRYFCRPCSPRSFCRHERMRRVCPQCRKPPSTRRRPRASRAPSGPSS